MKPNPCIGCARAINTSRNYPTCLVGHARVGGGLRATWKWWGSTPNDAHPADHRATCADRREADPRGPCAQRVPVVRHDIPAHVTVVFVRDGVIVGVAPAADYHAAVDDYPVPEGWVSWEDGHLRWYSPKRLSPAVVGCAVDPSLEVQIIRWSVENHPYGGGRRARTATAPVYAQRALNQHPTLNALCGVR